MGQLLHLPTAVWAGLGPRHAPVLAGQVQHHPCRAQALMPVGPGSFC